MDMMKKFLIFLSLGFLLHCASSQEEQAALQEEVVAEEEAGEDFLSDEEAAEELFEEEVALEEPPPSPPEEEVTKSRGRAGIPAGRGLPELGAKLTYVVMAGDTLAKISKKIYGDMNKWRQLQKLSGIENPNLIHVGDLIYYQLDDSSLNFAQSEVNRDIEQHVVQEGENLAVLAEKFYGSKANWKYLWRLNSELDNPDHLPVGFKLTVLSDSTTTTIAAELAHASTTTAQELPMPLQLTTT